MISFFLSGNNVTSISFRAFWHTRRSLNPDHLLENRMIKRQSKKLSRVSRDKAR
jgi:hypothetical protein